jgi:hypothetical protein
MLTRKAIKGYNVSSCSGGDGFAALLKSNSSLQGSADFYRLIALTVYGHCPFICSSRFVIVKSLPVLAFWFARRESNKLHAALPLLFLKG